MESGVCIYCHERVTVSGDEWRTEDKSPVCWGRTATGEDPAQPHEPH